MALWTDLITPAELTGFVRAALEDLEVNNKSLARWLPNTQVNDLSVRFVKGRTGLVAEAQFRAFDAEPELAGSTSGQRVNLDLSALSQKRVISEYDQLRMRNASDDVIRNSILKEGQNAARAIADRIEKLRGIVLETGKATSAQSNFSFDNDFGRSSTHTVTAGTLWSATGATPLENLLAWVEVYRASNDGEDPGTILMSRRAFAAMAGAAQFKTALLGGATRPALEGDVMNYVSAAGLPTIELYDRRTQSGRVISDNKVLLLPAAVAPNEGESLLGATFWGQTLTSLEGSYGIAPVDQPGVVVGAHKSESIPHIATVESDAVAMPVLANADLSFVATVL